jgi:hypothetical protein
MLYRVLLHLPQTTYPCHISSTTTNRPEGRHHRSRQHQRPLVPDFTWTRQIIQHGGGSRCSRWCVRCGVTEHTVGGVCPESQRLLRKRQEDETALRLALGPPGEVALSEFWPTILYFGELKKIDIPVPRPFTDLLTRYNSEDMDGYSQLQLLARFFDTALANSIRAKAWTPTKSRVDVEELIVAAISMGLDVHEGSPNKTPFQVMLSFFVTP